MDENAKVLKQAEFSPKIKTYIFLVGIFYCIVTFVGIAVLPFWLLGIGQRFSSKYFDRLRCSLTEKNLSFSKGILFRIEKTIPLENIQDLTFVEGPLLRYLNLSIIKIETAGSSNPKGSDMQLIGIVDAREFRNLVLKQREVIRTRKEAPAQVSHDDKVVELLTEIRDLLRKD